MNVRQSLPRSLALRFDSLGSYVRAVVAESEESISAQHKLNRKDIERIQLVAFVVELDRFFNEGAFAAEKAVDELERLDIPGFVVGTTEFSGRNENVILGRNLSAALREKIVDPELLLLINKEWSVPRLVRELVKRTRRERKLD